MQSCFPSPTAAQTKTSIRLAESLQNCQLLKQNGHGSPIVNLNPSLNETTTYRTAPVENSPGHHVVDGMSTISHKAAQKFGTPPYTNRGTAQKKNGNIGVYMPQNDVLNKCLGNKPSLNVHCFGKYRLNRIQKLNTSKSNNVPMYVNHSFAFAFVFVSSNMFMPVFMCVCGYLRLHSFMVRTSSRLSVYITFLSISCLSYHNPSNNKQNSV